MEVTHLTAGARAALPLVRDDEDRYELIDRVSATLGQAVLTYCVMDTHVHVIAEAAADRAKRWFSAGIEAYLRAFNRRWRGGGVLRDPIDARPIPDEDGLLRAIRYDHENPLRTRVPLVERAIDYPWSGARAFAGLSLAPAANVERATELIGPLASRLRDARPPLADLDPRTVPVAGPRTLILAAADVYGTRPWDLPSPKRAAPLPEARALFLRLGQLEGYSARRLAPLIHRSQQQASVLVRRVAVGERALRIARTLVRDPALHGRLPRVCRESRPLVQIGESYQSRPSPCMGRH